MVEEAEEGSDGTGVEAEAEEGREPEDERDGEFMESKLELESLGLEKLEGKVECKPMTCCHWSKMI